MMILLLVTTGVMFAGLEASLLDIAFICAMAGSTTSFFIASAAIALTITSLPSCSGTWNLTLLTSGTFTLRTIPLGSPATTRPTVSSDKSAGVVRFAKFAT